MGAVDLLEPISLTELQEQAGLQSRMDRKYIVPPETAELLLAESSGLLALDIEGSRSSRYESVYFDTPELESYLGAAHSRRRRFKVRTRGYLDSGLCMLEVKTAGGRGETVKERFPHDGTRPAELDQAAHVFLAERLPEQVHTRLRPALTTRYARSTLLQRGLMPGAPATRLTIDSDLVCTDARARTQVLLPGGVIVETKSPGAPTPADRWLWAHGQRPLRVSKYCVGLALVEPGLPSNKWHRTLDRHFVHGGSPQAAGYRSS